MNVFEKVIEALGWDAASLQIPEDELKAVLAMPENRALSYSIAFMQQLYCRLLAYKEVEDEDSEWASYWWERHKQFRNILVKLTKEFDSSCYDNWCSLHWYPNEFKVQR